VTRNKESNDLTMVRSYDHLLIISARSSISLIEFYICTIYLHRLNTGRIGLEVYAVGK